MAKKENLHPIGCARLIQAVVCQLVICPESITGMKKKVWIRKKIRSIYSHTIDTLIIHYCDTYGFDYDKFKKSMLECLAKQLKERIYD